MRALIAAAAAALLLAVPAGAQYTEAARYISVTAYGSAERDPDMASVTFGVDVTGYTAAEAVDEASELMRGAMAAAVDAGIDEDAIRTSSYGMWTEEEYDPYTYEYTGKTLYHVSNYAVCDVDDTDEVGEAIAALVSGGANYISSVTFTVRDRESLYAEARSQAVARATDMARQLAAEAGVVLGRPTMISEYSSDYYDPYYYDYGYGYSMNMAGGGEMAAPVINPSSFSVQTSVSITFEIE